LSHTHAPPTHRKPCAHALFAPHLHTPFEQLSAVSPQLTHATPPVPQAVVLGVAHDGPWQHPLAQLCAQPAQLPF
jgi:hypothetical protein